MGRVVKASCQRGTNYGNHWHDSPAFLLTLAQGGKKYPHLSACASYAFCTTNKKDVRPQEMSFIMMPLLSVGLARVC